MTKVLGALLALFFLGWPITATAQQQIPQVPVPCVIVPPHAPGLIQKRAGESVIFSAGVVTDEGDWQLNIQHNPNTGQSTVFMTLPNEMICAIFSGEGVMIPYTKPKGDPS